jgi:hypothetical protein
MENGQIGRTLREKGKRGNGREEAWRLSQACGMKTFPRMRGCVREAAAAEKGATESQQPALQSQIGG